MKISYLLLITLLTTAFSCSKDVEINTIPKSTIGVGKVYYNYNSDSLIFPIVKKNSYDSGSFITASSGTTYSAYLNETDTNMNNKHLVFNINTKNRLEHFVYYTSGYVDSIGNITAYGFSLIDGKDRFGNVVSNYKDYDWIDVVNGNTTENENKKLKTFDIIITKNKNLILETDKFSLILND